MRVLNLSLLVLAGAAHGQGTFRNMDFEAAGQYVTPTPPGQYGDIVDPNLAFQGWTVGNASFDLYNNLTAGSPAIDLIGPEFPNGLGLSALHGSYSVVIQNYGSGEGPTLSQTATVPSGAKSLGFLVDQRYGAVAVSFNGVNIPLIPFFGGTLLAGDVTRFAGQTAQLTFTATGSASFDFIQFSTASVPEPSASALAAFGAAVVLLHWCLTRR
ncbi:MAG: hypothetical protein ACREP9_02120 [Candidatus Dormibacteraceae bacterium]